MGDIFKTLRVLFHTACSLFATKKKAAKLASLNMSEFLPQWLDYVSNDPNGRPVLRLPAEPKAIAQTESRIGAELPEEIREFYLHTNGVDWSDVEYQKDILPVEELRKAGEVEPRLSKLLLNYWEETGKADGEPCELRIFTPSVFKLVADEEEQIIPFSDVDDMILLERPDDGITNVFVYASHPLIPRGTILEVENGVATMYPGIKAWMAQDAVFYGAS